MEPTRPDKQLRPASSTIIREIPLIQRYSRHNEAEDIRFRAFLKSRLNLTIEATDAVVRETTDQVWQQIDCTTCANCCRTLQVVVDNNDIQRLAKRLGLTPRIFSRRYVAVAEDKTKYFASSPCVFLADDNRCSVYEDRPQACRDFPYLHNAHFVSRSLMMIANTSVCPIVFNVWQSLKEKLKFRKSKL